MFCRVCGNTEFYSFLNLGKQPLANAVLTKEEFSTEKFYPLNVDICKNCHLPQLDHVVPPDILFSNYSYFTGHAGKTWTEHLTELARILSEEFHIQHNDFVVDIGSNDGTLLQNFKCRVLGFEPAKNVSEEAIKKGISTSIKYFSLDNSVMELAIFHKAQLILCTNTFAHIDNWHELFCGVKALLSEDGAFVVGVPHFLQLFLNKEYDTVYHEHLSYILVQPLETLGRLFNLNLYRVEKLPTHGGSLRLFFGKTQRIEDSVSIIKDEEFKSGVYRAESYITFQNDVNRLATDFQKLLYQLNSENKTICGYGHPAKATVILNYCDLNPDIISYVTDLNPAKQGKFSPGTHIPIVSPDVFHSSPPDYAIMFPWNYKEEILELEKEFINNGGKFIIPLPKVEIIP